MARKLIKPWVKYDRSPVRLEGNIIARLKPVRGGIAGERWNGSIWQGTASPAEIMSEGVKLTPIEIQQLGIPIGYLEQHFPGLVEAFYWIQNRYYRIDTPYKLMGAWIIAFFVLSYLTSLLR